MKGEEWPLGRQLTMSVSGIHLSWSFSNWFSNLMLGYILETALPYAHTNMKKTEFVTQWVVLAEGPGGKLDLLLLFHVS